MCAPESSLNCQKGDDAGYQREQLQNECDDQHELSSEAIKSGKLIQPVLPHDTTRITSDNGNLAKCNKHTPLRGYSRLP